MSVVSAARAARSRALILTGLALLLVVAVVQALVVTPARADTSVIFLKASQAGSTNPGSTDTADCPQSPPLWGWHFILDGNDHDFLSITATFLNAGVVTSTGPFGPPSAKHAYLYTPTADTLLSATATVSGPPTTDDFQLSHICTGGSTQSESPSPSPSPSESSSPSPSPSVSPSESPSPSPSVSESSSPSPSPSATVSESPSPSPSVTVSESPSPEVSASDIVSESPSPEVSASDIVSESPSPEVSASDIVSESPSPAVSGVKRVLGGTLTRTGSPLPIGILVALGLGMVVLGLGMTVASPGPARHRRR